MKKPVNSDVYGPLSLDVILFVGKTGRTVKRQVAVFQYINIIGKLNSPSHSHAPIDLKELLCEIVKI